MTAQSAASGAMQGAREGIPGIQGLLWEEPVGVLFHNSGERLAYIKNLRYRVDRYEAYTAWVIRRNDYDDCKRSNRPGCSDPGPAPQ